MIRSLKQTDLSAIRAINAVSLGYDVSLEKTERQFQRCSNAGGHFFLVYENEADQGVLGYIHAQVYESLYSETGLNILGLAVLPNFQGQGIGSALLEATEKLAKENGYTFIRLNSADHRKQAHHFYEQHGYISDKLQKRFIKIL